MHLSSLESPPTSSPAASALVSEIVALHGEIITAARTSLDKAIRIGELLTWIKSRLAHGQWLPWLKANIPFAERTARNYMRCHAERERLKSASVADLGEAYRLLSPPPESESEPKTAERYLSQAVQLCTEARDALESECEHGDLSPENAARLSHALTEVKAQANHMLEDRPALSCGKLLFVLNICTEMELTLKSCTRRPAA